MQSYYEKNINDELQSHMEDMAADLVSQGMDQKLASDQAMQAFGNIEEVKQELIQVDNPQSWALLKPVTMVALVYGVVSVLLGAVIVLSGGDWIIGTVIEVAALRWTWLGVIGAVLLLCTWITEYFGFESRKVLWYTTAFIHVIAAALTFILDVDKFEDNLNALFFSLLLIIGAQFAWHTMNLLWKKIIIYTNSVVVTWAILADQQLFGFIGKARCLFITPDNVPLTGSLSQCTQVGWGSPILFPLYLFLGASILLMMYYLIKLLKNRGTELHRKIIMTVAMLIVPIAPLTVSDVNNAGHIDVIPAKADIYQAYWDILGRAPEQKDIDFYAQSRAYEHIDRIQDTLYASQERKIKINLLYKEMLDREATPEEIDRFVNNRYSIEMIYYTLEQEHGVIRSINQH